MRRSVVAEAMELFKGRDNDDADRSCRDALGRDNWSASKHTRLVEGRRPSLGYPMAFALSGVIVILVPSIIRSTISHLAVRVILSTGEVVGPVAGLVTLGLTAE